MPKVSFNIDLSPLLLDFCHTPLAIIEIFWFNIQAIDLLTKKDSVFGDSVLLNKISLEKVSNIAKLLIKIKKKSKLHSSKLKLDLSDYKIELENKFNIKIDYLEFRDEKNLKLNNRKNKFRLFIAYNINGVRLIDNF